jgi:uncharacterized protein YcbK (DUF882 family)
LQFPRIDKILALLGSLPAWIARARAFIKRWRGVSTQIKIENRGEGRELEGGDFGNGRITNFSRDDLAAGTAWRNVDALSAYRLNVFLGVLKDRRIRWKVTSSWRSLAGNKKAGGAKGSFHLRGEDREPAALAGGSQAFDIWIHDASFFSELPFYVDLARRCGFNGVGLYESQPLIHIDTRGNRQGWGQKKLGDGSRIFVSLNSAIAEFGTGTGANDLLIAAALAATLLA